MSDKNEYHLFKCKDCKVIIEITVEEDMIEKYWDDKLDLECPCGGDLIPLRD